jgi:hypothetical protein
MKAAQVIVNVFILSGFITACAFAVTRTAENALLPEGKEIPIRTPKEKPRPLYPGCGELQIGWGTCTIYDGYIDDEWINAMVYDVSDTCGQSDGLPNEPGTVYLYLMMDNDALYLGVDAVGDPYQDCYDQAGLYFDDNDDGCWPPGGTTSDGNIWLVEDLAGGFALWRWWQDYGCSCDSCLDYYPHYTNYGGLYYLYDLCGFGISTVAGHMQMEIGINFGEYADSEYEIQTYLNLGKTCGFYLYYLDYYYYDFMGEIPCTGTSATYIWPCSWPSLVGEKPNFTFSMDVFQTQVPIGGTLDFAAHFHNNTCQTMTIYDTTYAYKGSNLLKKFAFEWSLECEQDMDICFALQVPEKDQFICWDITIVNSGVAVSGGDEYPFEENFDVHIEPGHKSEVICP